MYQFQVRFLDGPKTQIYVEQAHLGFNYITKFSVKDRNIRKLKNWI